MKPAQGNEHRKDNGGNDEGFTSVFRGSDRFSSRFPSWRREFLKPRSNTRPSDNSIMTSARSVFILLCGFSALLVFNGCLTANSNLNASDDLSSHLQLLIDEAEAGDPGVQYYLGWMYEHERHEPQSNYEAARWYRLAADQGYEDAMYRLGVLFDRGEGVGQDLGKAAYWYRRGGEAGDARSQYNLALMYDFGEGVERDQTEAARWYRKAVKQGYAPAQNNLGVLYAVGEGVDVNSAEAVRWYRNAAEQHYARAQYNLGMMYYYGRSVRQSFVEAYAWCYLSMANGGNPEALRHIVPHLNRDQVRQGLLRAGELQRELRTPWMREDSAPDEPEL